MGFSIARRLWNTPTVPLASRRVPTSTPAICRRPEEHDRQRAGVVHQHELERGRVVLRHDPERAHLAGDADLVAPARLDDRRDTASSSRRGAGFGVDVVALGRSPAIARSASRARRRRGAPTGRRAGTGTVVTLACGSRDRSARNASAVRSCRTRCHAPRYLRSGSSTLTSVSPSASSRATHLHGGAGEPAVGAADDVERHPGEAEAAPLLGQLAGHLVVDGEVHDAQLVGREAAGVLDRRGRWPCRGGP